MTENTVWSISYLSFFFDIDPQKLSTHYEVQLKNIISRSIVLTDNCSSTSEQDEQAESVGEFVQAKQIDENYRGERNVAGCKIN